MGVLHNYECAAHGVYESSAGPKCPYGCAKAFQRLVFLQAPGTRSQKTKFIDRETRALAAQYRMTNIKSSPDGESVMQTMRRTGNYPDSMQAKWLPDVPHAAPGWSWNKPLQSAQKEAPVFDVRAMTKSAAEPVLTQGFARSLPPPIANTVFVGKPKSAL